MNQLVLSDYTLMFEPKKLTHVCRKMLQRAVRMHYAKLEEYRKRPGNICADRLMWKLYPVMDVEKMRRFQIWEAIQLTKVQAIVRGMLTRRVVHSAMCSPDADALPRAIDYCQRTDIECPPFPKLV